MNMLKKYLLSNVARLPEGVAEGAPPPPADEGEPLTEEGLREVLAFDPGQFFARPAKEGQDADGEGEDAEGVQGSADGAASSAKAEPPPSPPDQDPAKKAGEADDPMAALREAVKGFLDTKPQAQEQAAQPAPAEKTAEQAPAGAKEEPKGYEFDIPDRIVNALASEEPTERKGAVNALVNGLANKLAKDFGTALATAAQHIRTEAVKEALASVQGKSEEQRVRDDFYSAFPDIKELTDNLPAMDGLVWQTAHQLAAATKAAGWTPQLRDQVGATLRLQLKLPVPQNGTKPAPQAQGGRQPRKPSFNASAGQGGGARPNGAGGPQDEMLAVVQAGG